MPTCVLERKNIGILPLALSLLVAGCSQPPDTSLDEVTEFGFNPGELRMFEYVPDSAEPSRREKSPACADSDSAAPVCEESAAKGAPLVVALHGCAQDAAGYGKDSGWIDLANRWGFQLLLPQQQRGNNLMQCFSWYSPEDVGRDVGEALSIRQMISYMQRNHAVDPKRIYITGISAGAAMTLDLTAAYPELFSGAAPIGGIAYGCADGLLSALSCMRDPPDREPAEWGKEVRGASSYKGPWPRISVWQGEADSAVDPANAMAIVSQWTNLHGIDSTPKSANDLEGSTHNLYQDAQGRTLVEAYWIKDMGHGVPVDPGTGEDQCGKAGRFFPDVGICSSLWIGRFWGLDRYDETREAHSLPLPLGEGWGEATIRGETTFHHPGWRDSPHDR